MPAAWLSRIVARCPSEPLPTLPMVRVSGFAFAAAMTSAKLLYGFPAPVVIAIGAVPKIITGAKSFSGLKGSFGLRAWCTEWVSKMKTKV